MRQAWHLGFLVGILSMAGAAWAQDPLEVGPDVYSKLFENERVRVMKVHFDPGDAIALHAHPDHFAYLLSDSQLTLSYPDGSTKDLVGTAGEVIWINAESHAAKNVGATPVDVLVVEFK